MPWVNFNAKNGETVILTLDEICQVVLGATKIRIHHIREGHKETYMVNSEGGWNREIEGRLAEWAVYKYLLREGVEAEEPDFTVGEYNQYDIPGICEIRCTAVRSGNLLIQEVGKDAKPSKRCMPYVLAIGSDGTYAIKGWCFGYEHNTLGTYEQKVETRNFLWWIPQRNLRPMSELIERVKTGERWGI